MIPSKYVRDYYEKKGITFSDADKAAIWWNRHDLAREEILSELEQIAGKTSDEDLRKQIESRLAYESKMDRCFAENENGQYIYALTYEGEKTAEAFFSCLGAAEDYARKAERGGYQIEKYRLADGMSCEDADDGYEGRACYDADGSMKHLWCNMPEDEMKIENGWERDPARFENRPVYFDIPFQRGDIVRICGTSKVGVVENLPNTREEFMEMARNGTYFDFLDSACLKVEFLNEQGGFSHGHPYVFALEKTDSCDENSILFLAGMLLRAEGSLDYFLERYDKNREVCLSGPGDIS